MKIVIISDWFVEKMGYSDNCLPKALAKLGDEVHLVASDLYPDFPNYKETYEAFLGPRQQAVGTKCLDGFTLHRLGCGGRKHGVYLKALLRTLSAIRPDIVQCITLTSLSTHQAAFGKLFLGYKFFLEEHMHMSVFTPPKTALSRFKYSGYRASVGNLISWLTEVNYPIAPDAAEVAVKYFGFTPRKIKITSLGVDTDIFRPSENARENEARTELRTHLGFRADDIVCVYSGRFSPGKNPLCLAQAIHRLQLTDRRFKGLFIGSGTPQEVQAIQQCAGCIVHPFIEVARLAEFYRASDIGVWPKQESTSQLDAAACGLPLILSNQIQVRERVDGNGLLYQQDDPDDLARQILKMEETGVRQAMAQVGSAKIRDHFSWDRIARERRMDYEAALAFGR